VRFDDSLKTVLAFDMTPGLGARSAWRQLVDLVGRGRVPADEAVLARLRELRRSVPELVRVATARGLATVQPGPAMVTLFAEDDLPVAATLLRAVTLPVATWTAVLPRLSPALRGILRTRRDLPAEAMRGLDRLAEAVRLPDGAPGQAEQRFLRHAPVSSSAPFQPTPLVPVRQIIRGLPPVAEATDAAEATAPIDDDPVVELVERLETFRRATSDATAERLSEEPATRFVFRVDAAGVMIWIDGAPPGALVGLSIAHSGRQGSGQVDGGVAGAFRRRSRFADARLEVGGEGGAAGPWRISGVPAFDPATGRFTGYNGVARRPRTDENAASVRIGRADSLRQLVHELRTPANAVAGFAELIESELMGPVPPGQRARAGAIRAQATDLVDAIDDLDTAARIDGRALEVRPAAIALMPLLDGVLANLAPLMALRQAGLDVRQVGETTNVLGDDRVLERLLGRLVAVMIAAAASGERLAVSLEGGTEAMRLSLSRPAAWHGLGEAELFSMAADGMGEGGPLLGTGFCLRLARNLAIELGGTLTIRSDQLVLRLPALLAAPVERASGS